MNREAKKICSKIGLVLISYSLIVFAVTYIFSSIVINYIDKSFFQDENIKVITNSVIMYAIGFPYLYFLLGRKKNISENTTKKKLGIIKIIKIFLITYALTIASNLVGRLITTIIGEIKGEKVDDALLGYVGGVDIYVLVLATCIGAPLFEEYVFRKLIIDKLKKYGEFLAIMVSGVTFGLFHGNFNQFIYALVIGMVFAYVYIRTNNILHTIILHAMINFIGSVVGIQIIGSENVLMIQIYSLIVFIIIFVGVILFFANIKRIHFEEAKNEIDSKFRLKVAFINVGMIIFVIYYVVTMILQIMG